MNDFAPGLRRDDESEQHRIELHRAELVASERRAGDLRAMAAKTTFAALLAPAPPSTARPSIAFALDRGAMAGMELVVVALGGGDVGLRLAGKPPPRHDLQKAVAALVAQLEEAGLSVREVGFHTMGRPQRRGP